MARRRDTNEYPPHSRPLRIVASGTLFLTQTLGLKAFPTESDAVRAQSVTRTRGGSASNVLSCVAQFPSVDAMLVAPLGGKDDGKALMEELEEEGVSTKYCKVWENASAPSAWVLQADDSGSRTVINHNPLPDITHEEFVSLLGPLLIPENYAFPPTNSSPTPAALPSPPAIPSSLSPAPFDWLHFEGRSVKTTLSNIQGIDGLAKERKWRSHCVFSLDITRKSRQGVEALIPHADVVFFSKQYALSQSANYTTPRPFLLSLTSLAAPHALLVVHWGSSGAALLSLPTREYFQSSGWVDEVEVAATQPAIRPRVSGDGATPVTPAPGLGNPNDDKFVVGSVRSGSGYWAAGHRSGTSSSAYTAFSPDTSSAPHGAPSDFSHGQHQSRAGFHAHTDSHPSHMHTNSQPTASSHMHTNSQPTSSSHMHTNSQPTASSHMHTGSNATSQMLSNYHTQTLSHDIHMNDPLQAHVQAHLHSHYPAFGPPQPHTNGHAQVRIPHRQEQEQDADGADSQGTETAGRRRNRGEDDTDDVGAQDAFVAGMIYALSRRMLPGAPYTPSSRGELTEPDRGRWKLEDCLRFASEMAGRKTRRKGFGGLMEEMTRAGWFDS
ncbi:hypothetical protein BD410DRAFT_784518 [Rickenella mellea]|uniref:Carbohydrate kinase PfkB domain-containing protein n=1 Tax=Rickenella mellea TaxID=50990 RepID=A0A4Y7QE41_9AGAM|nr:hypothetical protein BD410DRAFT_784518 [Rickenella mellea]